MKSDESQQKGGHGKAWSLMVLPRLLLFVAVQILLLPFQVVATAVYSYNVWTYSKPKGISGTANEPFVTRLLMHFAGTRPDPAALQLAPHLPCFDWLIMLWVRSFSWASTVSGYVGGMLAYPPPRPSTMWSFVSHRTEFFDKALESATCPLQKDGKPGLRQVVILGAGWDTRAWGILKDSPVRVFEVDAPATHNAKVKAVCHAGLDSSKLTFVACDFMTQTWLEALEGHGFDSRQPALVLAEGLTCYLSEDAMRGLLKDFAKLAEGSQLAFEYYADEMVHCKPPLRVLAYMSTVPAELFYGERFLWGITTAVPARSHVEKFLKTEGLRVIEYEAMGPHGTPFGGVVLATR